MRLRRLVLAAAISALAATTVLQSYAHHDNGNDKGKAKGHAKPAPAAAEADPCTGDPYAVRRETLKVDGQDALALVAVLRQKPRGIVVFDHGYGHSMES